MKLLSKVLFLLAVLSLHSSQYAMIDYQILIQPYVNMWQNECINKMTPQEIIVMADMLLLSYQVVKASCIMSQARLAMQTELLNIVTLSINDTLQARLQAENNDLSMIKHTVKTIEQAQEQMKVACNNLKSFGPLIIHIDPIVIQMFISNVKIVILNWVRTQKAIVTDLTEIEKKFLATPELFNKVQNIFEKICSTEQPDSHQLIEGTESINNMYTTIELLYANLTTIRKQSIVNFKTLLTEYFQQHYQVLYNALQNVDFYNYTIMATPNHKLPTPEEIFLPA